MPNLVWIDYRELSDTSDDVKHLPALTECVFNQPQDHEEEIARYLETAPMYSAVMKTVGDVLDRSSNTTLFPGRRTDGLYFWPAELAYYVRKYHVHVPHDLIRRMASLNWRPPEKDELDWDELYHRVHEHFRPKPMG
jgi:hypothetical protein